MSTGSSARPLIVPLFIPHLGCPHQCIFCNQQAITGTTARIPTTDQIRNDVNRFLSYSKKRCSPIQISFFGGNFLGLGRDTMRGLLRTATRFVEAGTVNGLRFSTRPDTIGPDTLSAIAPFPVQTVELGVQSMDDAVLGACRRGHVAAHTVAAARRLKDRGYQVGLQMMVGLPGDDETGALETARRLADLKPDFVRIYPTLVLAGSPLALLYQAGAYRPMPLDAGVTLVKRLLLYFRRKGIPVARMGLQASDGLTDAASLVAGPHHPAFGHLVHGEIVLDTIRETLGDMAPAGRRLTIVAHPTMVSRVQGLNKRNFRYLQEKFDLEEIVIVQDERIARNRLKVEDRSVTLET